MRKRQGCSSSPLGCSGRNAIAFTHKVSFRVARDEKMPSLTLLVVYIDQASRSFFIDVKASQDDVLNVFNVTIALICVCFRMISFRGQIELESRPDWSSSFRGLLETYSEIFSA